MIPYQMTSLGALSEPVKTVVSDSTTVNTVIQLTHIHIHSKDREKEDRDREKEKEKEDRDREKEKEKEDRKEREKKEEEDRCALSARQVDLLNQLYSTAKNTTKEIMSLHSMDNAMKIGRMIAEIVKLMEKASYRGEKIPGAEKKEIALELGKRLLGDTEVIADETVRNGALTVYGFIGEQMLDTLIDVSQHVNTAIKEIAVSCCEALLKLIKK